MKHIEKLQTHLFFKISIHIHRKKLKLQCMKYSHWLNIYLCDAMELYFPLFSFSCHLNEGIIYAPQIILLPPASSLPTNYNVFKVKSSPRQARSLSPESPSCNLTLLRYV